MRIGPCELGDKYYFANGLAFVACQALNKRPLWGEHGHTNRDHQRQLWAVSALCVG